MEVLWSPGFKGDKKRRWEMKRRAIAPHSLLVVRTASEVFQDKANT
jgi:hypothetical protein